MNQFGGEGEANLSAVGDTGALLDRQFGGGNTQNDVLTIGAHVQVDLGTHHLRHIDSGADGVSAALGSEVDVLGTNADDNVLAFNAVGGQSSLGLGGESHLGTVDRDAVTVSALNQLAVEEVHLGRTDEAGDEQVGGMIKDLLRSADLLDDAVLSFQKQSFLPTK